ncbi:MAG TPA: dihydrodipicolinate reductase C-terminal domain-containing protein [Thermoanaerobaculia bacterium]|nr:dihydrodipicolinate reductase C-terminal domain-containing protein [Thermoanaerobaculia bacterium]
MSKLALIGYGRMGKLVEQLAPAHGFEVVLRLNGSDHRIDERFHGVDVAIDFSTAGAVPETAERLASLGIPLVEGTTGWHEALTRVREAIETNKAGFLHGANFSVGVQVFYKLAEAASRLLAEEIPYEAWLYEIHHSKKKDAPSGTLLQIQRAMEGAGWSRGIDVASNRAGAIPGTHQIGFDSEADTITLQHTARSRAGFAHGALRGARWMIGRRGFYEFSQVWEEIVASR